MFAALKAEGMIKGGWIHCEDPTSFVAQYSFGDIKAELITFLTTETQCQSEIGRHFFTQVVRSNGGMLTEDGILSKDVAMTFLGNKSNVKGSSYIVDCFKLPGTISSRINSSFSLRNGPSAY